MVINYFEMIIKNKIKIFVFFLLIFALKGTFAQSEAGKESFAVLGLYNSAQMTARGMNFIPRFLNEASSSIANPSTLNTNLNNMISITYTDIFAGSYQGAIHYTHTFEKLGNFGFALQYINYGDFLMTESNGDIVGSFSANDYMFNVAWGRQIEKNLFLGLNFKPLFSKYESYSSVSFALDVSATWVSPTGSWQVSAAISNLGRQIQSFASQRDTLPTDIQIGVSKKLKHAPMIIYVVADNLSKWDIREKDGLSPRTTTGIDGTVNEESSLSAFFDKGFRHLKFAVDILPSQYFQFSVGYSWRQRQEMKLDDVFSLTGLSYGLNLNYKNYSLSYARNEYHVYGSPNYLTLSYRF